MTSEREPTLVDVGIVILEAVAVLHSRLPSYPDTSWYVVVGVHWRTAVTAAENMIDEGGNLSLQDGEAAFTYTTGTGAEIAGRSVTGPLPRQTR